MNKYSLVNYYRELIKPKGKTTSPHSRMYKFWVFFPEIELGTLRSKNQTMEKERVIALLAAVATQPTANSNINKRKAKRREHKRHTNRKYTGVVPCFACRLESHHRHHIVPLGMGGINSNRNQVLLCRDCHKEVHSLADSFIAQLKAEFKPLNNLVIHETHS